MSPSPSSPAANASTLAPFSIAAIWYQRPGTPWQKAWTRRSGAGWWLAEATKSCAEVPSETKPRPSSTAPIPIPPAGVSPAPPATTTPAGRPKRCARSGRIRPVGAVPSTRRGRRGLSRPTRASAGSLQSRRASSSSQVPAASETSVARSPVRWRRIRSLGRRSEAACSSVPGSWRASQRTFGAVKPAIAGTPRLRARSGPPRAWSSAASASARPSFHSMAGRSGRSAASSSTEACIWPERPTAATPAISRGCPAASRSRAAATASHQPSGSCSEASGAGWRVASGTLAWPRTAWASSTRRTLTAEVPRSMPRKRVTGLGRRPLGGDGVGGGDQLRLHEGLGVPGEVVAVGPEVAPDAQHVGEHRVDHGRGEGFEGDGPVVADAGEAAEHGGEVDRPGSEVAAVALADVEVAEVPAAPLDRLADEALLDVHVVGVEVGVDVRAADPLDQGDGLGRGVDDVGLVAVDDLDADGDARGLRLIRDPAQHLDDVGDPSLGPGRHVLLQGGVDHAAEVAGTQVAHDRDGRAQQVLAAPHRLGVLARDVGGRREAERRRAADPVLLELAAGELDREAVGVEERDLDEVVADLGRAADGLLAFGLAPAADPDQGVDAELAHGATPFFLARWAETAAPSSAQTVLAPETTISVRPQMASVRCWLRPRRLKPEEMTWRMTSATTSPAIRPKPPNGSTPPSTAARIVTSR